MKIATRFALRAARITIAKTNPLDDRKTRHEYSYE